MVLFIIAFLACCIGAISGIGGGVILKPLLDALTSYDSANISTLSAFTVFAMAIAAGTTHMRAKTAFNKQLALRLSLGAALGGIIGAQVLSWFSVLVGQDAKIKLLQNIILLFLLAAVLIYINFFQKKLRFHIQSSVLTVLCGVALGMTSAFLGIGGGPVNIALLCLFFSAELREAAVCSVIIILFSQGTKLLTLLFTGQLTGQNLPVLIYLIPGAILGGLAGAFLNRRLKHKLILTIYNGVMLLVVGTCIWNIFSSSM